MAPTKVKAQPNFFFYFLKYFYKLPIAILDRIPYFSLKILPGIIIIAENIVKLTTKN